MIFEKICNRQDWPKFWSSFRFETSINFRPESFQLKISQIWQMFIMNKDPCKHWILHGVSCNPCFNWLNVDLFETFVSFQFVHAFKFKPFKSIYRHRTPRKVYLHFAFYFKFLLIKIYEQFYFLIKIAKKVIFVKKF